MALSQRVDLTERGDFLARPLFTIGRLSNEDFQFTTAIETLYRNRDRRIEANEVDLEESSIPQIPNHQIFTSERLIDVVTLSKQFRFPWTIAEHGYVDSRLRNEDSLGRPKLVPTGNRDDILRQKRWQAHYNGYECECCGKDFTKVPWQGYDNLCTACYNRMGFDEWANLSPYPFKGIVEERIRRRERESFRLSNTFVLSDDDDLWQVLTLDH